MTHEAYYNEKLDDTFCTECGDYWPCLPQREVSTPVTVVHPNCRCGHATFRHIADRDRCRKPGCGCTNYRPKGAAA